MATMTTRETLRVLVVDDDADTTESLACLLNLWGFDARTARDGESALNLAESYRPGAILLDLQLPGMDGLEVARRVRRMHVSPRPLVLCMTGRGEEEVCRGSLEAGCDLYLLKPTDPESLRRLLCSRADALADA
jgi:DNA-binding response OmpR family regulator